MKKLPFLFAIIFGIIFSANAQKTNETSDFEGFQKSITFDLTGQAITRGFKFDRRLKRGQRNGYGFKVGAGSFSADRTESIDNRNVKVFSTPIEVNYIFGKRRHGFLTGIGAIPTFASTSYERKINGSTLEGQSVVVIGGFVTLGYRFTPLKKGISLQVNYSPTILKNETSESFTSISIGYTFK